MGTNQLPDSLTGFSLIDTLVGRRSRRFGVGMSIPDGPFAYSSTQPPQPLSEIERALLVLASAGVTGWSLGMPHTASGNSALGANYPVRHVGRAAPSSAGTQSSELLVADGEGLHVTQSRNVGPDVIEAAQAATTIDELVDLAEKVLVRYSSEPLDVPLEPPHVSAHNRWAAMAPGTTLLVPVTDATELFMNFLGIFTGEGVTLWDTATNTPIGQPAALEAAGRLNPDARMPLEAFEALIFQQATADSTLMAYNAQLMLQGMGLGGWLFSGMDPTSLLGGRAADGVSGFGLSFEHQPSMGLPNPVGLDGYFETLATAYTVTPTAAVTAFIDRKFGPEGTYAANAQGPSLDKGITGQVERYDDETVEYFISVLTGLQERFGRFPGTLPSVVTSVYVQCQHIDLDFYDSFYPPESVLPTHRTHAADWHGTESHQLIERNTP